jgi:hypothetical protein
VKIHAGLIRAHQLHLDCGALKAPVLGCASCQQPIVSRSQAGSREFSVDVGRDKSRHVELIRTVGKDPDHSGRGSIGRSRNDSADGQAEFSRKADVNSGQIVPRGDFDHSRMIFRPGRRVICYAADRRSLAVGANFGPTNAVSPRDRTDKELSRRTGHAKLPALICDVIHTEALHLGAGGCWNGLYIRILNRIAVFIHHASGDHGARSHFNSAIRKLLAGLERDVLVFPPDTGLARQMNITVA